jgi:hypothetical protein
VLLGTIKTPDGKPILEVNIPQTLYELPLNQYVDFIQVLRTRSEGANMVEVTAKAISAFYAIDLNQVLNAKYDSKEQGEATMYDCITKLYGHATKLVDKHLGQMQASPSVNTKRPFFEFDGCKFEVPVITQKIMAMGAENVLPPLTVAEFVEAAEINRIADTVIDETGDNEGNVLLTKYLSLLAVLCRKEGEALPIDEAERELFIKERAGYFFTCKSGMIDAGTALDIDFFLTAFLVRYEKINRVIGFLYLQSLEIVLSLLTRLKPLPKQSKTQKSTAKKFLGASGGAASSQRSQRRATLRELKKTK